MGRSLLLGAVALAWCALGAAPAAAAITAHVDGDKVVLTGDDTTSVLSVLDGYYAPPGDDYAIEIQIGNGEPVDGGDACVQTFGAPVNRVFCGTQTINNVVMNLGGGNDKVQEFSANSGFDVLNSLTVDFGPGEDEVTGNWIDLTWSFSGGDGNDDLAGGYGQGTLDGGAGDDRLFGGDASEVMRGGPGADDITGLGGNDQIFGDAGNDTLVGSSGGDSITGGPGTDNVQGDGSLNSFSGNDTLYLADGELDSGACGLGADVVEADRVDVVSEGDCEIVNRTGSGGPGPGGGGGAGAVSLGKPGKVSAKKRLVSSRVSCPASAAGSCTGRATFTLTFTERGKKRKVVLGRAAFSLPAGKSGTVRRKISKKLYARLRRAKKRKLTLAATSRDAGGATFKTSRTFKLRF